MGDGGGSGRDSGVASGGVVVTGPASGAARLALLLGSGALGVVVHGVLRRENIVDHRDAALVVAGGLEVLLVRRCGGHGGGGSDGSGRAVELG